MKLHAELIPIEKITSDQREQMFALMDRYYLNVTQENFQKDLDEKHWAIVLNDPMSKELCGFSTQMLIHDTLNGRNISALYSGDTILERAHWGDRSLSSLWGKFALSLIDSIDSDYFYWILLSKGYKTYRYLPIFFHDYYPRPELATPSWEKAVLDKVIYSKFPNQYHAPSGIVVASENKDCLRPGIAEVTADRLRNKEIQFFHQHNPGHTQGDELCCIAPLTRENFTRAAYRVIGTPAERLTQLLR